MSTQPVNLGCIQHAYPWADMTVYADGYSTWSTRGLGSTVPGWRWLAALVGGGSLVAAFMISLLWEPAIIVPVGLLAIALTLLGGGVALYRGGQSELVRVIAVIVLMVGSVTAIGAFLALATVATNIESGVIEGSGPTTTGT